MPDVVGTAYVRLRLLTDTISKDIASAVEDSALQNVDIKIDADKEPLAEKLGAANQDIDKFDALLRSKLGAAIESLPTLHLDADADPAQRRIAEIRAEISGVTDRIGVDLDDKDAVAKIDALRVELDDIARKSPDIRVKVDAGAAAGELAALNAELDGTSGKTETAARSASLLRDAIVILGPSLVPVAVAAAAALSGIAAGAGVAVLAVKGVQAGMKTGTAVGNQFRGGIQLLQKDLGTLEATAAKAVLPGFRSAVGELNTAMPGVNHSVNLLGQQLGDIGSHVIVGLVAGLTTFEPLLLHVGQAADIAARNFQKWSTGAAGGGFAATLGADFDKVLPVLTELAQAAGKIVAAFAPIGTQVVGIIGTLASAVNAFPLPVLQGLADVFVALYAANRIAGVFGSLSTALTGLGASGALAETRLAGLATSAAGFTKFAGAAAATGFAVYSVGKSLSNFLEQGHSGTAAFNNLTTASSNFYNALIQSRGALDDTTRSSVQYQLQQDGLTAKAAKAGISQDQLTSAISGTDAQTKALVDTWRASGKPSSDTLFAVALLHDQYLKAADAAAKYTSHLDALAASPAWGALRTSKDSVQQVANRFSVSADAVKSYAALLGISDAAINNGVVNNQRLADAVLTVQTAYDTASAAGSAFLDALTKFSASTGTSADRAQLLGSYLKALQGDMLSYQGSVASGYQANIALTSSFKQQSDQVKAGSLALKDTQRAAINLRTGFVDVTKAGAAPLIQSLQQMQDAAMSAAGATYQHEVATRGAGQAAQDAAVIFRTQTYDALVKDASQLGLTSAQAKRLADHYFALPKDVATRVRTIGTDPVVSVLNKIGLQLSYLTGRSWNPTVGIRDLASGNIAALERQLARLDGKVSTVTINTVNKNIAQQGFIGASGAGSTGGLATAHGIQFRASGGPAGMVYGPGSGTSDTAGLFALSNGEWVTDAVNTKKYLPLLKAISGDPGTGTTRSLRSSTGVDSAVILAEIRALAAALADRPVQLVANGLTLAKVVNDANKANARRV
jgi:hypothetical protein